MGLNKNEGANTIYLSVADGNLVRQHKAPNDNTTERTTKTGRVVYEEHFKDLNGKLVGITTRENDYGKQWQLKFKDADGTYLIQMPYSSRYASSFLKCLPNVDLQHEIRFMPWSMIDRNDATRKITGITMYQVAGKVPPAFTKDAPNGLPEMKQIKVKGKATWDDSDMMEFLENMVKETILPQLSEGETVEEGIEEPMEDAPF